MNVTDIIACARSAARLGRQPLADELDRLAADASRTVRREPCPRCLATRVIITPARTTCALCGWQR